MNKDQEKLLIERLTKLYNVMEHSNNNICQIYVRGLTPCGSKHYFGIYRPDGIAYDSCDFKLFKLLNIAHCVVNGPGIEQIRYYVWNHRINISNKASEEFKPYCLLSNNSPVDFGDLIDKLDLKIVELV